MQKGRRDHFTPQGYLRGFIHPERLNLQKPLWGFNIGRREWREQSTSAIGWQTGLYDYPDNSNPDGTAEEVFLRPENDFPLVREEIRSNGFSSWSVHRETLLEFAAMLSARSLLFLEQAAGSISESLRDHSHADVLARNYALTTMRLEVQERYRRWRSLHWVLRFAPDPTFPVIASDQSVGMDGYVDDPMALHDSHTTLFFPVSWDMCLFGSPARLEPQCAEFLEHDLRRLWSFVVKQTTCFVVSPTPSNVIVDEFTS